MSSDRQSDRRGHEPDGIAEFTEELRLLAEVLLARVEPVLRRTAADGEADLGGCAWCPVCAAAALVRGDHHDVVAVLAEHGTSMVTVLREALAGVPVEPVLPPEWADHAAGHPSADRSSARPGRTRAATTDPKHHAAADQARSTAATTTPTGPRSDAATGGTPHSAGGSVPPGQPSSRTAAASEDRGEPRPTTAPADPAPDVPGARQSRWGAGRRDQGVPRPRRVDERPTARAAQPPHLTPDSGEAPDDSSATGVFAGDDGAQVAGKSARRRTDDRAATDRAASARYVDIPVTIRG
ncbi:hypothetical protein ACFO5K_09540 [Nocardia halotolerans]|uniref:DUF222 domain-containing protein n=1 Tax=Nocardia halotolerans TaxID=1755878 RepID=A0ABV8VI40_9NOCA